MDRVTKNGKGDPCRERASKHIERIEAKLSEDSNESARFSAYLELYNKAAAGVERCRENFEGDHYTRFLNDPNTAIMLHDAEREGVIIMKETCKKMGQMALSTVNGTSVEFAKCQALYKIEKKNLKKAAKIIEKKLLNPAPANDHGIKIRLKALEAIPALLLMADVMAA